MKKTTVANFQATITSGLTGDSGVLGTAEADRLIGDVILNARQRSEAGETSAVEVAQELPGMPAPRLVLRVPSEAEFGRDGEQYFISPALRLRAILLQERHSDLFEHLDGLSVVYLWRRSGGKSRGEPVMGRTLKPAGLLKMFSEAVFAIVLSADHCRAFSYWDREIEALLFHQLLRTAVGEVDEETGRGGGPTLVEPDVVAFRAEVEIYGLWRPQLRAAGPAFRQASLFGAPDPSGSESGASDESQKQELSSIDGAGVLIRDDGTPLTTEEIQRMEAAELLDEDYDVDDLPTAEEIDQSLADRVL